MCEFDYRLCAWRDGNDNALTSRPMIAAARASPRYSNPGTEQNNQHKIANKNPGEPTHTFRITAKCRLILNRIR